MKRKFLINLALAILTTVLLIALISITFFNIEFEQLVRQEKNLLQKKIENKILYFSKYLKQIEKGMEENAQVIAAKLLKTLGAGVWPEKSMSQQVQAILQKHEPLSVNIYDQKGTLLVKAGRQEESEYFAHPGDRERLFGSFKAGEAFKHLSLVMHGKTGKKRKHTFGHGANSPYFFEIVQSLRVYVDKKYCANYYQFLFLEYFRAFEENSLYLQKLDLFSPETPHWSFLKEGEQLAAEVVQKISVNEKKELNQESGEVIYYSISLKDTGYPYLDRMIVKLSFKKNAFRVFNRRLVLMALGAGLLIFVLLLLIYSKIFDRYFISRVLHLRDKINQVGNGYYGGALDTEGQDEIADMGQALNRMQMQIQNREKELNQANAAKLQFLGNVNHELRTPMTPIIGMLQLLSGTQLTSEQREYVEIIQISSQSLLRVIQNILDFSEIQKGEIHIQKEEFSLERLMEEASKESKRNAQKKNLSFDMSMDKNLSSYYIGPEVQIKKILIQLFDNAVKFTEKGGIRIEVSQEFTHEQETQLKIVIRDTGIGISEEDLIKIFEFFNQVDYTSTRRYGGLGIGLGIARELLHMINGNLDIASEVNKGSSFILTFPLLISMIKQESKKEVVTQKKLRILIAEDNLSNREMMKMLLEHKNWNFDVVYNGRQVIEKFKEMDYDLILMDVQMPEMDGFETTRAVRKIEEEGKYTPILAVTAFYMEGYEKLCKLSGMDGYLEKPVNTDKFYHLIEELIRLKR